MGFFSSLFGGNKKEEVENVRVPSFKELQKDDTIQFNTFYDELLSGYSEKFMKITSELKYSGLPTWFELEYGELYLKNDGKKVELLKQFDNTDDFVNNVDMEVVNELLNLDDGEIVDGEIVSRDREIPVINDSGFMKAGLYNVCKDTFVKLNGEEVRYIQAKTADSANFIYIVIKAQGETLIYASITENVNEFSFF